MATVKQAMDKAARECSLTPPDDWISTANATYVEMKDFLDDTVDELLDRVDWPSPIGATSSITGPGTLSSSGNYSTHSLPSATKRIMRDDWSVWEESNTRRRAVSISMDGQWGYLDTVGSAGAWRYYRTAGDEDSGFTIDFFRAVTATETMQVNYVSKNWLRLASDSSASDTWTDANDTLLLPKRLIELGVVWRFRQRKGLGYQDKYGEYEIRLTRTANDYRKTRKIGFGGPDADYHPMRVPVPDIIPSS